MQPRSAQHEHQYYNSGVHAAGSGNNDCNYAVMCSHRLALGIMSIVHTVVVLFVYLRMSWFGQELSPMGVHNLV